MSKLSSAGRAPAVTVIIQTPKLKNRNGRLDDRDLLHAKWRNPEWFYEMKPNKTAIGIETKPITTMNERSTAAFRRKELYLG